MLQFVDPQPAPSKTMREVSVWMVNILPQMRKTFGEEELGELRESVDQKGMLNPPIVALFTRQEAVRYLSVINRLWGSTISLSTLRPSTVQGKKLWYILLAGERRTRSYRTLVKKKKKPCEYQVVVYQHLDPLDAIDIQFSENCHRRVSPEEEAHAYGQFWALLTVRGFKQTYTGFSRRVGRSPQAIKAAMLFVSLPQVIRSAVAGQWSPTIGGATVFNKAKLKLPYGIAVELARLRQGKPEIPERELLQLMKDAVIYRTKVEDFRARINALLQTNGQSMIDLLSAGAEADARKMHRRRTIEAGTLRTLHALEVWFARVLTLFQTGQLGKADSTFALGSVRRQLEVTGELYEKVFALAYSRPAPKALQRLQKVKEVTHVVRELEEQLPF